MKYISNTNIQKDKHLCSVHNKRNIYPKKVRSTKAAEIASLLLALNVPHTAPTPLRGRVPRGPPHPVSSQSRQRAPLCILGAVWGCHLSSVGVAVGLRHTITHGHFPLNWAICENISVSFFNAHYLGPYLHANFSMLGAGINTRISRF